MPDTNEQRDPVKEARELCAQCEANARWNDAGGYHELAKKCRDYCRRGHKEDEDHHA